MSTTSREHANYALYRSNLGGALQQRYRATRRSADTEEAADVLREAVAATPEASPYRPGYLGNLGSVLLERYQAVGQTAAFDEAIIHLREAVRTVHPANVQRPALMNSLARALLVGGHDLDEAIGLFRSARADAPPESLTRVQSTINLAGALIAVARAAEPPGVASPGDRRWNVLRDLLPRGRRLAETPALDEAIALLTGLLDEDATAGPEAYAFLGQALQARFTLTGRSRTLLQALRTMERAVEVSAPGSTEASVALYHLAEIRVDQWRLTAAADAREEALARFREAAAVEAAAASWRAGVGRAWGRFAMECGRPAEATDGFAVAVGVLDEAAWRGLGRDDQERVLADHEGLARDAAAAAVRAGRPETALELLEQGRGVMLAQVLDSRTSQDLLRERAPGLAEQLAQLQDALDLAERSDLYDDRSEPRHLDQRPVLARRRRELLAEIRKVPGLTGFLRPPRAAGLLSAAEGGPVALVNVSDYGCDALLVTTGGIRVLPLTLTAAEARQEADRFAAAVRDRDLRAMATALDWIWTHVTGPVLDALGPVSRIWWCPTGPLTGLPLHSAGPALDRVISSYTPTVRALVHARSRLGPQGERRRLLIGVPVAPGESELAGVGRELELVRGHLGDVDELTGPDATHERVLALLDGCSWMHFAGHAVQELDAPAVARLLLSDRPLTLRELAARRLDRAEFAFLSGCETSRGGDVLADEATSLAGSVQLAGFPHVIGTLWPIVDVHAPAIVDTVYQVLTAQGTAEPRADAAAVALHLAVRSLRDRRPGFPYFWAGYVHVGP
ncbi:CHAT domain-containing protein [Herbidospora galbida]|uniref:CHAT domain-containing protein n=1 Tax=Herbidospora galbida TaxID=2575442 RepID=A0A4U3M9L9_9ACTN|nr:CHAT domain-containing protein [Herbidospora galbida]TKK84216.1 CHAT domain-containing protein [Herbidospora galbida]